MSTSDSELIRDPKKIVEQLLESKSNGTVIGILSPLLGRIVVLTGVEDLSLEEEPVVVLKPFNTSGNIIADVKIPLSQIELVQAFRTIFGNPLISKCGDGPIPVAG